jgi:hypothetical protein
LFYALSSEVIQILRVLIRPWSGGVKKSEIGLFAILEEKADILK